MADSAISDLTNLPSALTSGDKFEVVRSGVNYQADADDLPTGGGGVAWTLAVNADGSTTSGFTTISGSWAASGGALQQTGSGADSRLLPTGAHMLSRDGMWLVESPVMFPTGASGYAGFHLVNRAGDIGAASFRLHFDGSSTWTAEVGTPASNVIVQALGTGSFPTGAPDTYFTLRMLCNGAMVFCWIDGVYVGSYPPEHGGGGNLNANEAVSLWTYGASTANFDYFKMWTADLGLPA